LDNLGDRTSTGGTPDTCSAGSVDCLNGVHAAKNAALDSQGSAVTAATLKGFNYSGLNKSNGNTLRGAAFSTKGADTKVQTGDAANKAMTAVNAYWNAGAIDSIGGDADTLITFGADGTTPRTPQITGADFKVGATTTKQENEAFRGTFFGASGEYTCTSGTCTASVTGAGVDLGDGWTFSPTAKQRAELTIPDKDYQEFGWWISTDDGEPRGVALFSGGKGAYAAATGINVVTPTGKATYEGGAAGIYARYSESGDDGSGKDSRFTAAVKLTADFETSSDAGTVSGEINSFMVDGASETWRVYLLEQDLGVQGNSLAKRAANTGETPAATHSRIRWHSGAPGDASSRVIGSYGGYYVNAYGGGETAQPAELGGAFRVNGTGQRLVGSMAATK